MVISNFILGSVLFFSCSENTPVNNVQSDSTNFSVTKISDLPSEVDETSGLIIYNNLIWTFNDSGGDTAIFGISEENGSVVRKITLSGCNNKDWEAIAQNENYIFIGDIGNNDGSRKDLCIYFFEKNKIDTSDNLNISVKKLAFSYEDQKDFSPAKLASSFDCEAMTATEDSIYLYSKDWVNLVTTVYSLPVSEGNHIAGKNYVINSDGLITGADLKDKQLVLCGYNLFNPFIIIIDDLSKPEIFNRIELVNSSGIQVEGITIKSENEFLISNEKSSVNQALHIVKLVK